MGQYSQWLYYREVDQQLQAQLEVLARELARLQERTHGIEQSGQPRVACLQDDNKIILALSQYTSVLKGYPQEAPAQREGPLPQAPPGAPTPLHEQISPGESTPRNANNRASMSKPGESISSALFAWSSLPNFGPQEVPSETPETAVGNDLPFTPFDRPLPPVSHGAMLPEDMGSFIDEHTMTDPQIELPWWFRNITPSLDTNSLHNPIDQESVRTNRLVQRWLERWGRQSTTSHQQPGEKT